MVFLVTGYRPFHQWMVKMVRVSCHGFIFKSALSTVGPLLGCICGTLNFYGTVNSKVDS